MTATVCDVCGREIHGKPAASARGRWGLVLCSTCWARLRGRERRRVSLQAQGEAIRAEGGAPFDWPLCEWCGQDLDAHGLGYYTTHGKRRRFCCVECRQANNSRVGNPIRVAKLRERIGRGLWQNPAVYHTPESLRRAARAGGAVRAETFRAEVAAGTWSNPADAPGAREKLSRPRVHGADPILHRAIEKLNQGGSVADLEPAEAEAHRAYRRRLRRRKAQRRR